MGIMDNLFSGKKLPLLEGFDSIVGQQARFKGELHSKGSINVNGEYEGKLFADGEVVVSPSGKVVGEIHGGTVIVSGRVDGNINAKETLEVTKNGRIHGDLVGGRIIIEEGSYYHGRVKVESPANSAVEERVEPIPALPDEVSQPESFPNF